MRIQYGFSLLCAALGFWAGGFWAVSYTAAKTEQFEREAAASAHIEAADFPEAGLEAFPLVLNMEERPDIILEAYRNPEFQNGVTAFFRDLTGSQEVAEVVLSNAAAFDISPALAFALSWEESRYTVRALNRNKNGSIDRGLFQLNNTSFPDLNLEDFFDPATNARYGLAHLRWCLTSSSSEVSALAMYNAGTARVRDSGTPKSTLNYVSRILKRQRKIEELFEERFMAEYISPALPEIAEAEINEKFFPLRLSLLTPPGRR